ncbi:MAG: beta-N-acetylhexosaminidase [Rhizobiales bacterium]|nr:beta-N-acetylhexosaminidase [Hyphomicrobiales bacterium]
MSAGAFICGCAGTQLNNEERAFVKEADPWGLIVFGRNVDGPEQIRALTESFRSITGRSDAPVLIDQEGGRVQRMGPPHWRKYPPARRIGELYEHDPTRAIVAVRLITRLLAEELFDAGINVDCLPVLDVPQPGSHDVIGDRAYSNDPASVAILARAAVSGLMEGGVLPVIKHIPGHGRAAADSHLELPVVDTALDTLRTVDFAPFAALADLPMAMTAHVVYTAIDRDQPATLSQTAVGQVMRQTLGYDGLIMTDDLSMKALEGSMNDKIGRARAAGCDIMLHCNGNMAEMHEVAAASGSLSGAALDRAGLALASARAPREFDRAAAMAALRRFDVESV